MTTSRSAFPADRFAKVRGAVGEFELFVVGDGRAWPMTDSSLALHCQTRLRERAGGPWRVDIFREPWSGDVWICRRDPRIRLPSRRIARTSEGSRMRKPEVVLLLKASAVRPKDDADFVKVLPHLDARRRRWLRDALRLFHPRHLWLEALESG